MLLLTLTALALSLGQASGATKPPGVDPAALGPRLGDAVPSFQARDQDGRARDFASLAGPSGLVLVFFRSADW